MLNNVALNCRLDLTAVKTLIRWFTVGVAKLIFHLTALCLPH